MATDDESAPLNATVTGIRIEGMRVLTLRADVRVCDADRGAVLRQWGDVFIAPHQTDEKDDERGGEE